MNDLHDMAAGPMADAVRSWLAAGHVPPDAPLVVACSGGADSLALAVATQAAAGSHPVSAAIVDHGLQSGSAHVAAIAANTLQGIGYHDVEVLRVDVDTDGGMEAAARRARYAALGTFAASRGPQTAVLLAHTCDDQAETVLLGLARGSGPRSIAGMRPWRRPWGRPLLEIRRDQTEHLCALVGITPWQDPQNVDPAFTRVRLRREVLPLLEEVLGGGVAPALARTSELMADDLAALDELTAEVQAAAQGSGGASARNRDREAQVEDRSAQVDTDASGDDLDLLRCSPLRQWPSAIRRRVIRRWIAQRAGVTSLTYRHLARLENLAVAGRPGAAVRVPGTIDVIRDTDALRLRRPR